MPNIEEKFRKAVESGNSKAVKALLASGVDVNASLASDFTALHLAAHAGQCKIVELLIAAGADINAKSVEGTALHLAALAGRGDVALMLLEAGARTNSKDEDGDTPVAVAKWAGYADIARLIRAYGGRS